jgi:hypothetical protein
MRKVLNLTFIVVFGWLGWMMGERISFMTAYFLSGIASILGFYLSWKLVRRLEE